MDARRKIGSACIGVTLALSPSMVIGQEHAKPGLDLPPGAIPGVFDSATGVFSPIDLAAPQASGVVSGSIVLRIDYDINPAHQLLSLSTVFCVLQLEFSLHPANSSQRILYHRETKSYNFALGDRGDYSQISESYTAYNPDPAGGEREIRVVATYECTVTEVVSGARHTSSASRVSFGPNVPTSIAPVESLDIAL
jgi:hypothetical protein